MDPKKENRTFKYKILVIPNVIYSIYLSIYVSIYQTLSLGLMAEKKKKKIPQKPLKLNI